MTNACEVDSRDYIIAYELPSPADVPPDFPASPDFDCALFLPRDDEDLFGRSSFPPRVLTLSGYTLTITPHPTSNEQTESLVVPQLSFIETGQMLLRGWVRLVGRDNDRTLRYNRRHATPVEAFLAKIHARFLGTREPSVDTATVDLGAPLDFKFQHAMSAELALGEVLRPVFFQPAREYVGHIAFLRRRQRPHANLVALTSKRLLWITDFAEGFYAQYGLITRYAPPAHVARIQRVRGKRSCTLRVDFHWPEQRWDIALAEEHFEAAAWFEKPFA